LESSSSSSRPIGEVARDIISGDDVTCKPLAVVVFGEEPTGALGISASATPKSVSSSSAMSSKSVISPTEDTAETSLSPEKARERFSFGTGGRSAVPNLFSGGKVGRLLVGSTGVAVEDLRTLDDFRGLLVPLDEVFGEGNFLDSVACEVSEEEAVLVEGGECTVTTEGTLGVVGEVAPVDD